MCNSHDDEDEKLARELLEMRETPKRISRRGLMLGAGAAAVFGRLGGLGSGVFTGSAAAATPATIRERPAGRPAGMHVHGSWSEGMQSWQQACASAIAVGIDVLYFTDHNYRARATDYMTNLSGTWIPSTTGSLAAHAATLSSTGSMRLMAKAARNSPAAQLMTIEQSNNAFNHLRTGIGGQSMEVTFGNVAMGAKTMFEVVVSLSSRPATSGRKAGQYFLRYRFLPGVDQEVATATRAAGWSASSICPAFTAVRSSRSPPRPTSAALWPDIHPKDNGFFSLAFVATTAAVKNSLIDVTHRGCEVHPH